METFRITGPGWYMTRDGRRVVIEPNPDNGGLRLYPWRHGSCCVTDKGQEFHEDTEREDNDIVSRCPDTTPAPAHETKGEAATCHHAYGPDCVCLKCGTPMTGLPARLNRAIARRLCKMLNQEGGK